MNNAIPRRSFAIVIAALLACACACALAFAAPHKAHAAELASAGLTAQSANSSLTTANARFIKLGSSTTVRFTRDDNSDGVAYCRNINYWFSYRHSNRRSVYTIRVDSIDGVRCSAYLYDENLTKLREVCISSDTPTVTLFDDSADLGKQYYVRVGTGFSWYGNSWVKEIHDGDAFRVTVTEHPIIKRVTGVNSAKRAKRSITLKWNSQANATKYQVKWKKNGGSWKTTTVTSSSKKFTMLKKRTKYQFKVRAYCANGYDLASGKTTNWTTWPATKTVKTGK